MHACSSAVQVGAVHTHVHTNLTQHNGLVVTTHGTADVCEAAKADDLDDAVSDVYLRPSTSKRTPIGTLSTKSTTTSTTTTTTTTTTTNKVHHTHTDRIHTDGHQFVATLERTHAHNELVAHRMAQASKQTQMQADCQVTVPGRS